LIDFLPEKDRGMLAGKTVQTSILQHAPFINSRNYRTYLPFMPLAIEQLDLSAYYVIISNSHAVIKGVITSPEKLHISYVHTPTRYAWDIQNEYLQNSGMKGLKGFTARILLHYIRNWDVVAANRPDRLIANSGFVARRIKKIYRHDAQVIYPPVDTNFFCPDGPRGDFYFTASRFVPYKRIDLIVEAFRGMPDKKLVIIGDGPELPRMQPKFGNNVIWLGHHSDLKLREQLRNCRAFIFEMREDFGIMPVEAQACGAPVIAFGEGGAVETVRGQGSSNQTGIFFGVQSVEALQSAIWEFEGQEINNQTCRSNAERFSTQRFQKEFSEFVEKSWEEFRLAK
jgi:glycosyltransferase involved in cell wall biosynthesis